MRSLLLRVFLSFWSIIVITIAVAATLGYVYAERARETLQGFEVSEAMLEASDALAANGRDGLTDWLESLPDITASAVYIIDDRGQDLLDRRLPAPVVLAMRRFGGPAARPPRMRDPANLRPARPFTQLLGPNDEVYTLFVLPPQGAVARWVSERSGVAFIVIALLVSAGVSYLLARGISRPIQRVRESANAIAGGNLDTRVMDRVGDRRDDIGLLAQDFDDMTAELQRAWQRQTELTANVSHELRSPLARLRVALELARRKTGELPELDKIDLETERLDALIGQLLEFSKMDADPHEARSRTDLDELLRSVVEDVRYEFEDTGIRIELESASAVAVDAHAGALRSAIENVLRNAAQHSPANGEIVVTLETGEDEAVLSVEDQGGGVPDDDVDRIFEPFYRSTATSGASGTGLGLAIASRGVAVNGGSVMAKNSGQGLRIEIRLPAAG